MKMTKERFLETWGPASNASFPENEEPLFRRHLNALIRDVRAEERERCAKVAEQDDGYITDPDNCDQRVCERCSELIAAAIREGK